MKNPLLIFIILVLSCSAMMAQKRFLGNWAGKLAVQTVTLTLEFTITEENGKMSGTMAVPEQNAVGIYCDAVSEENSLIYISVAAIGGKFEGSFNLSGDTVYGVWKQSNQQFKLQLSKTSPKEITKSKAPNRPQMPKPPFPYSEQEVSFLSEDGMTKLSGTISIPAGPPPYPAAILVSGSGGQDRDETLLGHKPFWVLSDTLTKRGLVVLRYDDRGVGKSEGNFSTATTYDFAADAAGAIKYLQTRSDIRKEKIGIIGHSEGGMVAQILGAKKTELRFLVFLAAPGIACNELLIQQNKDVMAAEGELFTVTDELITRKSQSLAIRDLDSVTAAREIWKLIDAHRNTLPPTDKAKLTDDVINGQIQTLLSPWFRTFLRYTPSKYLEKIKIPTLALNGEKDIQVAAKMNLAAIEKALKKAKNNKFIIKNIPGLNHLFQTCSRCSVSEYGQIEETFSPLAMKEMFSFFLKYGVLNN